MSESRLWLSKYPTGVPANIDADKYSSVVEFIDAACEKFSSRPAFYCMGKSITYAETKKLSDQFGAYLHSRGLEPGDKVAIMMPNLLQYPIAVFGCLKAGLVVVNTNPLYTPREMEHQFLDSEIKGIILAENFAKNLSDIFFKTKIKATIITSIGEMLGAVKGKVVDFMVRKVKRMVPKYELPNTVTFSEALKQGKKFILP
ncbi:MAG: AMP-binding protein, partial [Flavobacteriales bacterium]|nr:AMP-binding protein [Flavobacteriales bacterium]